MYTVMEYKRLVNECFCTLNNGGMADLMNQLKGFHSVDDRNEIVSDLAKELKSYNEEYYGIDMSDDDYETAATDEFALRAIDYSDDNMFALENQDLIDESRMDWIMNKE